mmetsp:Transcript_10214/g.39740  ORF Transcript_10214/g.39740 Transcript_10214/m.39740 type:complete len:375 (+) Transcript_10214:269-1393(+)
MLRRPSGTTSSTLPRRWDERSLSTAPVSSVGVEISSAMTGSSITAPASLMAAVTAAAAAPRSATAVVSGDTKVAAGSSSRSTPSMARPMRGPRSRAAARASCSASDSARERGAGGGMPLATEAEAKSADSSPDETSLARRPLAGGASSAASPCTSGSAAAESRSGSPAPPRRVLAAPQPACAARTLTATRAQWRLPSSVRSNTAAKRPSSDTPSLYATVTRPSVTSATPNSLLRRSTATSRCSLPMPESSSWPVSASSVTRRLGSCRTSTSRAASSCRCWPALSASMEAVKTGSGSSRPGSLTASLALDDAQRVSPVRARLRPAAAPIWPAGTASTSLSSSAKSCSSFEGRSAGPGLVVLMSEARVMVPLYTRK